MVPPAPTGMFATALPWLAISVAPHAVMSPWNAACRPSKFMPGFLLVTIGNTPLHFGQVTIVPTNAIGRPSMKVIAPDDSTTPPWEVVSPSRMNAKLMVGPRTNAREDSIGAGRERPDRRCRMQPRFEARSNQGACASFCMNGVAPAALYRLPTQARRGLRSDALQALSNREAGSIATPSHQIDVRRCHVDLCFFCSRIEPISLDRIWHPPPEYLTYQIDRLPASVQNRPVPS